MTLIWFVVWFIADRGASIVNPVNIWAATLILAVALDLGAATRTGARVTHEGIPAAELPLVVKVEQRGRALAVRG